MDKMDTMELTKPLLAQTDLAIKKVLKNRSKNSKNKVKKVVGSKMPATQKWERIDNIEFLLQEIRKIKESEKS